MHGTNAASPETSAPLSRGALRHEIVKQLLADIFQGRLEPGARLIVQKLATRFGVSSTPVREALVELESVGMAQFMHNRGAVVKAFGPQELREIFHLRRILEVEATRCAAQHIPGYQIESLKRELLLLASEETGDDWSVREMASDRRLHELIAAACGSQRLADEIGRYDTLMQTIREIVGNRRKVQSQAVREHLPIVDALLLGNPEVAAEAMARHIARTVESVEAIMFGST